MDEKRQVDMRKNRDKMPLIFVGIFITIVLLLALSVSFLHFLFFLFFPLLLITIFIFVIYIYSALVYFKTNLIRWIQGKTPKLSCVSKDCLDWSREEAMEKTKQAIDEMESLTKDVDAEWSKSLDELLKDALVVIENESASKEELYDFCEYIRKQMKGAKGIRIFWEVHDWLLEKADKMNK